MFCPDCGTELKTSLDYEELCAGIGATAGGIGGAIAGGIGGYAVYKAIMVEVAKDAVTAQQLLGGAMLAAGTGLMILYVATIGGVFLMCVVGRAVGQAVDRIVGTGNCPNCSGKFILGKNDATGDEFPLPIFDTN